MTPGGWLAWLLTTAILSLSQDSGAITTLSTDISHGHRGATVSLAGQQPGWRCILCCWWGLASARSLRSHYWRLKC